MYKRQVLTQELEEIVNEGCDYVQFDEPVWTENVNETFWAAEILNEIIAKFPNVDFNLHVCGGNAHRKRGFFGKYTDMIDAFKILKVIVSLSLINCVLEVPTIWIIELKFS